MSKINNDANQVGAAVALRSITTDGRIDMCWPCRVVRDTDKILVLFIAAGSPYKAGPKQTAASKRLTTRQHLPPDEYIWRHDTLRIMLPGQSHSVSIFWNNITGTRQLLKYFINMEEPFRRTAVGFDTQDHTLDIEVSPDLAWRWRDEEELDSHVIEGFYTPALAAAARSEGETTIQAILSSNHECMQGWSNWAPPPEWAVPQFPPQWHTTPATLWERRQWAYADV
ncbi:MAG: DUF402 domain-containing protein [Steroidobacteraceae bacterium]